MAIGDTSIIKDANGVSITVKDVAADYLVEQLNGIFNRENFRTDASLVMNNCRSITFGPNADRTSSTVQILLNTIYGGNTNVDDDKDTSLASLLADGTVQINKSGRYLILANVYFYYTASCLATIQYVHNASDTTWKDIVRSLMIKDESIQANTAELPSAKILKSGVKLRLATNKVIPLTNKASETRLKLVYLGE